MITSIRAENGVTVVDMEGRFDASSAPQIKEKLHGIIKEGQISIVVNLGNLRFIDSAGLGVLVSCLRRVAAEGGDLRLAEVPAFCRSIFELTRLTRVFDVNQSEQEAIKAFKAG
ncbi:MAG: STAS domain-containing protein [Planctomycetes bacterium]|nr:STAS domain-containing protein [Planctomycetota bacterium]